MAERRYFVLLRGGPRGREHSVFTGRQPRQAALKAASRGHTDIYLRERGTKKVHHFRGSRRRVAAPYDRPDWMASTVWKPNVRKVGIVRLEKPKAKKKARRGRARRARRAAPKRRAKRRVKRTAKRIVKRRAKKKTVRRTKRRARRRR